MRTRLVTADYYYGWVVVATCFVAATVVFGLTYSFGVFFQPLLAAFPVGTGALSLAFGVQTFVLYAASVLAGGVVDRYGPRRVLAGGSVLLAVAFVGVSQSRTFVSLLWWYGLVAGLGMSAIYIVAYSTVPKWFGRRRGLANGIASSGLGLGLLVVAPTTAMLVARFGWRSTYLVLGGVTVCLLLPAAWLLADDPESVGADTRSEFPDYESRRTDRADGGRRRSVSVADTVRSLPFGLVALGWMLLYVPLYVLMNHVVRYAEVVGMAAGTGVLVISVVGGSTSLARLLVGYLSDHVGRVFIFTTSAGVMGVTFALVPFVGGRNALLALAVCFGVGYGGAGALLSPFVADLFGADDLSTLYGFATLVFAVSGLVAPPLAGFGYEWFHSYTPVFVAAGVVGLSGAGIVALASHLARR